jgi:hypothetical protein
MPPELSEPHSLDAANAGTFGDAIDLENRVDAKGLESLSPDERVRYEAGKQSAAALQKKLGLSLRVPRYREGVRVYQSMSEREQQRYQHLRPRDLVALCRPAARRTPAARPRANRPNVRARSSSSGGGDPPDPEPQRLEAEWRGVAAASVRLDTHIRRRNAKAAAA